MATWLRGDAVDVVHDGGGALERIGVNDYDVVVLDRDLPVVHGDEFGDPRGGGLVVTVILSGCTDPA